MPLEVFFSYSHRDEDLRDELEKHLSLLEHSGLIAGWHDRRIDAGAEWGDEIDSHARSAQIILLLISSDFLASEYCYGVEMKLALERHRKREAVVIPIILRPVDWAGAPFAFLQALPRNARPVTSWTSRDEALADVARGIREMIARLRPPETPADDHAFPRDTMKPRVVDAAIPSHIVKDRATELLVLIRLPESAGLSGVLADEDSEAGPEDVRSRPFSISFPIGPTGLEPLKVAVNITSPDFAPPQQTKSLMVPVNADSEICSFLLSPIRIGELRVLVELQWEDVMRGHRTLRTVCVSEAESARATARMNVVQMPVAVGAASVASAASGPRAPAPTEVFETFSEQFGPASSSAAPRDSTTVREMPAVSASSAPKKSRHWLWASATIAAALGTLVVGTVNLSHRMTPLPATPPAGPIAKEVPEKAPLKPPVEAAPVSHAPPEIVAKTPPRSNAAPQHPVTVVLYDGAETPKFLIDGKATPPRSYQSGEAEFRLVAGQHSLKAEYPNRVCTADFSLPAQTRVTAECGPK
jgi:hypothetical protein